MSDFPVTPIPLKVEGEGRGFLAPCNLSTTANDGNKAVGLNAKTKIVTLETKTTSGLRT